MFVTILKSLVRDGSLGVIDAGGRLHKVGDGSAPSATIRVTSKAMEYRLAVNPALMVGEAYMNGGLRIENGTLYDFAAVIGRNADHARSMPWLALLERAGRRVRQSNPMSRARRNVGHHYDLSNEFYAMFLDRDLQYSCAYFRSPDDDLETAQANKKRHIMAKLLLDRPGLRVLDIGSGWGGMCLDIAAHCDTDIPASHSAPNSTG